MSCSKLSVIIYKSSTNHLCSGHSDGSSKPTVRVGKNNKNNAKIGHKVEEKGINNGIYMGSNGVDCADLLLPGLVL